MCLRKAFPGCDFIDAAPDEFSVARLEEIGIDVLIDVCSRPISPAVAGSARHGLLSFQRRTLGDRVPTPTGVWEALNLEPTTTLRLKRFTRDDNCDVLAQSRLPTIEFAPARNAAHATRNAARLLSPVLSSLQKGSDGRIGMSDGLPNDAPNAGGPAGLPSNADLLTRLPAIARRYLQKRFRHRGTREQWFIAWKWMERATSETAASSLESFQPLFPPPDRLWADPFVAVDGERHWMFFEEQLFSVPNAVISVCEMTESGPVGSPRVVLREPWHLSFSGVFHHDGRWWMLPESGDAEQVILYAATDFPFAWERHRILLHERMADPVLVEHGGLWYLFGSPYRVGELPSLELHIYVADQITGPFRPHPENPVSVDPDIARMAGHIFRDEAGLFRPAQVCVPSYGAGMSVRRILELSPSRYREEEVSRHFPTWFDGALGMHTLNAEGRLAVTDLLRRVADPREIR